MADVPSIPDYKVVLPKGQFNGLRVHYTTTSARTRTLAWAGRHCVGLPAAVGRARINLRGHGCHSLNPRHSHTTLKTKSV